MNLPLDNEVGIWFISNVGNFNKLGSRGKWVEGGGGVEKRTMGPWERRVKNKNQCQE